MAAKGLLDEMSAVRDKSILSYLDDDQLAELSSHSRLQAAHPGEVFLRQGERGDSLAILLSGEAQLFNQLPSGREFALGSLQVGRSVDFSAVLADTPWHLSARMKSRGKILWIEKRALLDQLKKDRESFGYLERITSEPSFREFSRGFRYLEGLDPADVRKFMLAFDRMDLPEGAVIQEQDREAKSVFVVREGQVRVEQENSTLEDSVVVAEISGAEMFGHSQIAKDQRVSMFRYVAATEVSLWAAPIEAYLLFVEKYPAARVVLDRSDRKAIAESRFGAKPPAGAAPVEEDEDEDEFDYDRDEGRRRRFPIVRQRDQMDCAAACMAMVCKYYGIDVGVRYYRNAIGVGPEGASMYGIASAAERTGFLTRGIRVEYDALMDLKLPAITTQKYHFTVLFDVNDKGVVLGDPESGLRRISKEEFLESWNGILLLFNVTPEYYRNQEETNPYGLYLRMLSPYRKYLVQILLTSALLNLLGLIGPVMTQVLVDRVLPSGDANLLFILSIGALISLVFIIVAGVLRRYFVAFMSLKLDVEMNAQFMRHLLRLPAKFFASRRSGDMLMRLHDIDEIRDFVTSRGTEALMDAIMLLVYTAAIFVYDPAMGALFVVISAVFFLLTRVAGKVIVTRVSEIIKHGGEAQSLVIENIKSIATIKAFGVESSRRWLWEDKYTKAALYRMSIANVANLYSVFIEVIGRALPMAILFYGAHQVLQKNMTMGQVLALSSLFAIALSPLMELAETITEFQRMVFGLQRLNDIFSTQPEDKPQKYVPVSADQVEGHLRFEGVSFRYGNEESPVILDKLDLEIRAGEKVAVIGRSGSGKTTFSQLVNRLFDPFAGRILLDGQDIRNYPLSELRRTVAVVSQETKLVAGTILENIALGDQFPDIRRAVNASILANADDFIRGQPSGYFQSLLEDGMGLSGGQKQRVAIARALYRDPRILILDEATAFLDNESESAIEAAMPEICKGRTVILIAHKLATVRSCDRIFVMEGGTVIEQGTHDELVKAGGAYSHLLLAAL